MKFSYPNHHLWIMDFKLMAPFRQKYFQRYSRGQKGPTPKQQLCGDIMSHNKLNFS